MEELNKWAKALEQNTVNGLLATQGKVVGDSFTIDIRTKKNEQKSYTVYFVAAAVGFAAFSAMYFSAR